MTASSTSMLYGIRPSSAMPYYRVSQATALACQSGRMSRLNQAARARWARLLFRVRIVVTTVSRHTMDRLEVGAPLWRSGVSDRAGLRLHVTDRSGKKRP